MALDPLGIIFWLVFLGILSGGYDAGIKQGLLALQHTKGQHAAACIGAHDDIKELGRAQTSPPLAIPLSTHMHITRVDPSFIVLM